ncbi:MAG: hypothetical protein M3Z06_06115 [Actinomycetota bacterium]|nr:hypothetical protein [Actinomycetota bacterium]
MRAERLAWESADGPDVGGAVAITAGPRDEQAPGIPQPPPTPDGQRDGGPGGLAIEEREVRAKDPELSGRTNARLTEELREVVGADRVRVPKGRPHARSHHLDGRVLAAGRLGPPATVPEQETWGLR